MLSGIRAGSSIYVAASSSFTASAAAAAAAAAASSSSSSSSSSSRALRARSLSAAYASQQPCSLNREVAMGSTPGQVDLSLVEQYHQHAARLAEAKQRLGSLWPPPPALVPPEWGDSLLLRFLVGFKYDVEAAAERFQRMLEWAAANDIAAVRAKILGGLQPADYPFRCARCIIGWV